MSDGYGIQEQLRLKVSGRILPKKKGVQQASQLLGMAVSRVDEELGDPGFPDQEDNRVPPGERGTQDEESCTEDDETRNTQEERMTLEELRQRLVREPGGSGRNPGRQLGEDPEIEKSQRGDD